MQEKSILHAFKEYPDGGSIEETDVKKVYEVLRGIPRIKFCVFNRSDDPKIVKMPADVGVTEWKNRNSHFHGVVLHRDKGQNRRLVCIDIDNVNSPEAKEIIKAYEDGVVFCEKSYSGKLHIWLVIDTDCEYVMKSKDYADSKIELYENNRKVLITGRKYNTMPQCTRDEIYCSENISKNTEIFKFLFSPLENGRGGCSGDLSKARFPIDDEKVRSAQVIKAVTKMLSYLDCEDYDSWSETLCQLREMLGYEQGYDIALNWSLQSDKFNQSAFDAKFGNPTYTKQDGMTFVNRIRALDNSEANEIIDGLGPYHGAGEFFGLVAEKVKVEFNAGPEQVEKKLLNVVVLAEMFKTRSIPLIPKHELRELVVTEIAKDALFIEDQFYIKPWKRFTKAPEKVFAPLVGIPYLAENKKGEEVEKYTSKNFLDYLFQSPNASKFHKHGIVCSVPSDRHITSEDYNTWEGFTVDKWKKKHGEGHVYDSELIKRFEEFVLKGMCSNDEKAAEYLLNWMAHIFQFPDVLAGTAVVMSTNKNGTGKTFVPMSILGPMLGNTFRSISQDVLLGKHTDSLDGTVLALGDEFYLRGKRTANGRFKSYCDAPTIDIISKYRNDRTVHNFVRFWFTGNADAVLDAEESERRQLVLDNSDTPYYKDYAMFASLCVQKQDFNPNKEAEYHIDRALTYYEYFLNRDLSKFSPRKDLPTTARKERVISDGMNLTDQFINAVHYNDLAGIDLEQQVDGVELVDGEWQIKTGKLFDLYRAWCHELGKRVKVTSSSMLGKYLSDRGYERGRNKSYRYWTFESREDTL